MFFKKWQRRKEKTVSKCNFCGERYQTGEEHETYICPECEEKLVTGRLGHEKAVLAKHWQRKGLTP